MVGGVGSPLPRSDLRCVGAVGAVVGGVCRLGHEAEEALMEGHGWKCVLITSP